MRLTAWSISVSAVNFMIDGENRENGENGEGRGRDGRRPAGACRRAFCAVVGRHMLATSPCLARTASAASFSAASSSASRSVSTTRFTPSAPISASTPR